MWSGRSINKYKHCSFICLPWSSTFHGNTGPTKSAVALLLLAWVLFFFELLGKFIFIASHSEELRAKISRHVMSRNAFLILLVLVLLLWPVRKLLLQWRKETMHRRRMRRIGSACWLPNNTCSPTGWWFSLYFWHGMYRNWNWPPPLCSTLCRWQFIIYIYSWAL